MFNNYKKLLSCMVGINQFSNRTMIKNPEDFFGRRSEIRSIFSKLSNFESCDVFGERKIGKSSLLYHIYLTHKGKLDEEFNVVYIDLQNPKYHTVDGFLKNSLEKLGSNAEIIQSSQNLNEKLIAYSDAIEKLRETCKPVLLIDECDKIANKTEEFNNDFIDTLRNLGTSHNIAYVTASLYSLKTLCTVGNFTSPFYNIFSEIPLAKFTPEETFEFISVRRDGVEFDDKDIKFIKKIAKNHPLHLQISCYHVLESKGKNWNQKRVKKIIKKEVKSFDDINVKIGRMGINGIKRISKWVLNWIEKNIKIKIGL